uniref:Uncharacterized protein n=1 Tax=Bursaphelenchus xylophilus TaxID=6326 RepID=A0A1I7SG41_BURXY
MELNESSQPSFKEAALRQPLTKQAYITQQSYEKFLVYLDDTCQIPEQHNADVNVNHVDERYFEWEQYNFNKALLHHIFPETANGDDVAKLLTKESIRSLDQDFFAAELPSNCTSTDNDWTFTAKEPDVFQDNLINW